MTPYFSIIIPVFNGAKYVERAIDQLSHQKFKDFELIIVDDGSIDDSLTIANRLAENFDWLHVISQCNSGPGFSRNIGMSHATGKYILFLDVDDIYYINLLSEIFKYTISKDYDVIIFSYVEKNLLHQYEYPCIYKNLTASSNNDIKTIFKSYFINLDFNNGFTWNRVFRREFLVEKNILFDRQRIQEDQLFNFKVYRYAETMLIIDVPLYMYLIHSNNSVFKYNPRKFENYCDVQEYLLSLCHYWNLSSREIHKYISLRFYSCIEDSIRSVILHNSKDLDAVICKIGVNKLTQECIQQIKIYSLQKYCRHFDDIISGNIRRLKCKYLIENKILDYKIIIKRFFRKFNGCGRDSSLISGGAI